MARNLTSEQLKPILEILRIKRARELTEREDCNFEKVVKRMEDANKAGLQSIYDAISRINEQIDILQKEVDRICEAACPEDPISATVTRTYLKIESRYMPDYRTSHQLSRAQLQKAQDISRAATIEVMLKYSQLEARVMLTDDYDEVMEILNSADAPDQPEDKTE